MTPHIYTEKSISDVLANCTLTHKEYPCLGKRLHAELVVRPLDQNDFRKGYMELIASPEYQGISQTTKEKRFQEFFAFLKSSPGMYYPLVVEDVTNTKLIGTGMLIVEQKFIHGTAVRGRIENINVNEEHRRKGVASLLLESLSQLAKQIGCYKTTLNCTKDYISMCEKIGFVGEAGQNFMLKHYTNNNERFGRNGKEVKNGLQSRL